MSHVFVRIISRYIPIITFPVAVVLGFIGYNLEGQFSNKSTPYLDHSINEERENGSRRGVIHSDMMGPMKTTSISQKNSMFSQENI